MGLPVAHEKNPKFLLSVLFRILLQIFAIKILLLTLKVRSVIRFLQSKKQKKERKAGQVTYL